MEQDTTALPEELQAPSTEPAQADELAGPRARTSGRILKGVGIVATGLVAGAIGIAAIQGSPSATNAASTTNTPPGGAGFRQGGPPGGPGGGIAGESRVVGTITSVGSSSITVKGSDGTSTTVPVNGTTQIIRNGSVSSLSSLKSGDQVLVHVIPSGTGTVAERILAGSSATMGGPGGFGGRPGGAQGQPPTGTTSTT
jgi:hypothetical protein